ncbi:hypothetical protein GP486_003759 [Trichoglossum hirsutum]|uniref:NYN domain-containing protein n=1 Tax=Trichoglossum hirsutum TaxID=265104 RepID=A0A9P8RQ78_9PEZI|nr:hypothetical protein GP486_003759 [Trichoglossum hirsutum]
MNSEPRTKDWDFEPVIGLLHSLSSGTTSAPKQYVPPVVLAEQAGDSSPRLGNFDRLWEFLGRPKDIPPPEASSHVGSEDPLHPADISSTVKEVRWQDDVYGTGLEDNARGGSAPDLPSTRPKRKKSSRAARVKAEPKVKLQGNSISLVRSITAGYVESCPEFHVLRENAPVKLAPLESHRALHGGFDEAAVFNLYDSSKMHPPTALASFSHLQISTSRISFPQVIQAFELSPAEKKARLISKLFQKFKAEQGFLIPLAAPRIDISSSGVHVFVDFSNILIGLCDCVKKSRGLNVSSYIRRPPFSFHSLSLILERGRPTAKKVLVGSKPLLPEIREAEKCGYETSILDKVLKVPTPRKTRQRKNGYGTSGQSSGSESNARLPERKVEQAVDEVLHLKIMESLLDWKEPATIVLATGDAAEAEYSGGFMKMVERALERDWQIELVSFRDSISNAYRNKTFRDRWKERFRIIELDDFHEELLISSELIE